MSDPHDNLAPPRLALILTAVLLVAVVVAGVAAVAIAGQLDANSTPLLVSLVGIAVSAVPAILAAAYAGRASNDLRNGMVVEKSRQGARKAIDESRPTLVEATAAGATKAIEDSQVLTRTGPVVTAEVQALQELVSSTRDLHRTTAQVAENTARIAGRRAGDQPAI